MERTAESSPASLAQTFWTVARRMRHHWGEALAPWDVTPSQLRTLGTLMRRGPARPSALARELGIAPRSVTEVVDALETRGLVARHADPGDRRASLLSVTEHGREVAGAIRAARATEADRLFDRLSEHDRGELRRLLEELLAATEEERTREERAREAGAQEEAGTSPVGAAAELPGAR